MFGGLMPSYLVLELADAPLHVSRGDARLVHLAHRVHGYGSFALASASGSRCVDGRGVNASVTSMFAPDIEGVTRGRSCCTELHNLTSTHSSSTKRLRLSSCGTRPLFSRGMPERHQGAALVGRAPTRNCSGWLPPPPRRWRTRRGTPACMRSNCSCETRRASFCRRRNSRRSTNTSEQSHSRSGQMTRPQELARRQLRLLRGVPTNSSALSTACA